MTASAAQPPFVVAGRIGDRQRARESDSRGQTACSTLFYTKRHMLRMTLVNQLLHATGISPVTPSQSLVNLFLHIAISYCVLLHIHFKLFVPNHELRHPPPPPVPYPPVGGRAPQGTGGNPVILEPDLYKQKQPCLLVML